MDAPTKPSRITLPPLLKSYPVKDPYYAQNATYSYPPTSPSPHWASNDTAFKPTNPAGWDGISHPSDYTVTAPCVGSWDTSAEHYHALHGDEDWLSEPSPWSGPGSECSLLSG
jgi:hypothetical protein